MTVTRVQAFSIVLLVAGPVSGHADSATATIAVSASVRRNCVINTTALAFGTYDPIVANATTPLGATATVTIACTAGTPAKIGLDGGSSVAAGQRRLTNGSSAYMNYEMYLDSGHTAVWGNEATNQLDAGTSPSMDPRTFPVYGQVPPGQDVPVGLFSDSVTATVNF